MRLTKAQTFMRFRICRTSVAQLLISTLLLSTSATQAAPLGLAKPLLANYIAPYQDPNAGHALTHTPTPLVTTKDTLQNKLRNVPQWLGKLDTARYVQLATRHFDQYENGTDLNTLSTQLEHDFAQRLLAKYVEYKLLARTGLWCDLQIQQGNLATQAKAVRYLLWLTGDYESSEGLIDDGIQLCQQRPQRASSAEYRLSATPFDNSQLNNSIKSFQQRHGIKASGNLDKKTIQLLSESPASIAERIHLNLQRMQSINTPLQGRHIVANIPEFKLALREGTDTVLELKTIVGKRSRPTPELTLQMTHVVLNPSWGVPRKLAKLDIIPKVIRDRDYLVRKQFSVYSRSGGNETRIPAENIDWSAMQKNFPYYLRQAPGKNNALGQFKFVTPNARAIYLHDTNSRGLFRKNVRAFSSGCLRVQNPGLLAQHVMHNTAYASPDHLRKKLQSGNTRSLRVADGLPVYIVYWTTWVDASGQLQQRDDIYEKDILPQAKPMFARNDAR
ncbi:MAG: L,D-transpeptidase family protein [Pseudomonadales bacterium]